MKYFKVRIEEEVKLPVGNIVQKRIEYATAHDSGDILEDCLNRFGENLLSLDVTEIDESKIRPNTRITVVYNF